MQTQHFLQLVVDLSSINQQNTSLHFEKLSEDMQCVYHRRLWPLDKNQSTNQETAQDRVIHLSTASLRSDCSVSPFLKHIKAVLGHWTKTFL